MSERSITKMQLAYRRAGQELEWKDVAGRAGRADALAAGLVRTVRHIVQAMTGLDRVVLEVAFAAAADELATERELESCGVDVALVEIEVATRRASEDESTSSQKP
jgi:hypothetical protein